MRALVLLGLGLLGVSAFGGGFKFDPARGKTEFLAKGRPALISIRGEGEGSSGELKQSGDTLSGSLQFRLETLKTGIKLRDEHMKNKYLNVEKYPVAELRFGKFVPPKEPGTFKISGTLLLHGKEHTVGIEGQLVGVGKDRRIIAQFPVRLSQFEIDIPSFQGVTVAEDVVVKVESDLVEQN